MPLTIESLRDRIGLQAGDASRDDEISAAMSGAVSLIEAYLDRRLILDHESEVFTHVSGNTISLIRYPVASITRLQSDGSGDLAYHLEAETGLIHFDSHVHDHRIEVDYDGGFLMDGLQDPGDYTGDLVKMPESLVMAIIATFDKVWSANEAGLGGGGTVAAGSIKQVRAGDLAISYETGSGAVSASSGGAFGGVIPVMASALLDLFKRQSA